MTHLQYLAIPDMKTCEGGALPAGDTVSPYITQVDCVACLETGATARESDARIMRDMAKALRVVRGER